MVKLVAVCRDEEDYPFENRQLPLNVDKGLTLVVQFDDQVRSGYRNNNAKIDFKTFIKNYNILHQEEVKQACMMNARDLSTFLSHMVPCVGCRRSVEQMFHQVAEQGHPALDPLVVSFRSAMSIKYSVISNPTLLYKLFYHDVQHTYGLIENILNNKKNKRCFIHSLEMQKPRLGRALAMSPNNGQACTNLSSLPPSPPSNNTPVVTPYYGNGSWMDIWNDLSNECKDEVVILDCEGILDLMEDYLKRHRFCKDCKSKVARAFGILVDEIDPKKESTYCSALYVGLRFCGPKSKLALDREAEEEREEQMRECERETKKAAKEENGVKAKGTQANKLTHDKATETSGGIVSNQSRHIHVCCETNYIAHLMTRAEAEISGGRRERHAKTIDVAQEEVLTCISLYLYERLHRLWKKVRAESQTWRVLFYVCVETMRSVFEICIEEKVGMGKLEALCEEFEEAERSKEKKQEKKRQKKKRQKKRKEEQKKQEAVEDQEVIIPCNGEAGKSAPQPKDGSKEVYHHATVCHAHHREDGEPPQQGFCQACDLGYSSGYCESSVSSREGSEVNCSDGFCNHEDHECSTEHTASFPAKLKVVSTCARKGCRPCEMGGVPHIATVHSEGSCDGCQSSQGGEKRCKKGKKAKVFVHGGGGGDCVNGRDHHGNGNFQSRLLEMLQEEPTNLFGGLGAVKDGAGDTGEGTAGDVLEGLEVDDDFGSDADGLTAEEIAEFELNRSRIHEERIVLREKIRKNFEHFCGNRGDGEEAGLVVNECQEAVTVANGSVPRPLSKGKPTGNGVVHSNGKKKSKK